MPHLNKVEANGAAKVYLAAIKEKQLTLDINGVSSIEGDIDIDELEMELAGSAVAKLKGTVNKADIEVNGVSKLKCSELKINSCTIETNGAAQAYINSINYLNAQASGVSKIKYKKTITVKKKISGAASIKLIE